MGRKSVEFSLPALAGGTPYSLFSPWPCVSWVPIACLRESLLHAKRVRLPDLNSAPSALGVWQSLEDLSISGLEKGAPRWGLPQISRARRFAANSIKTAPTSPFSQYLPSCLRTKQIKFACAAPGSKPNLGSEFISIIKTPVDLCDNLELPRQFLLLPPAGGSPGLDRRSDTALSSPAGQARHRPPKPVCHPNLSRGSFALRGHLGPWSGDPSQKLDTCHHVPCIRGRHTSAVPAMGRIQGILLSF